jgi:pimeloyl-ACP methyl ester carboxylesterase
LKTNVTDALTRNAFNQYIGNWSLVWGPVVWQDTSQNSDVADNVMMAAQNSDTKDIVVAIAGTNPNSAFDRGTEDLGVGTMVSFDTASGANISQGASDGITNLEGMTDGNDTLVAYLNGLQPTGGNLIFAGHSLGGALAPAYALYLVFNKKLTTSNFNNVYVYPTAGPSAGNAAYASLFSSTFPVPQGGSGFDVWNQDIVNSMDAVPRAWTDLASLPSLYPPINNGNPLTCIQIVVEKELMPALNGNVYADIPRATFTGAFNESLKPPVSGVTCQWLTQAIYQHIAGYFVEIVPDLLDALPTPTLPGKVCAGLDLWCDKNRT